MNRVLFAAVLALALPLTALAQAVVQSMSGSVQMADAPATVGQKIAAPTSISTGPGAQAFLQFEDGMQIVLGENSLLRIVDFRFTPSGVTDRAVFDLLRGGARVVTGKIALNSPKQFFFRTPHTQLTVQRPADFTVALVNPAYITVNSGTVLSSNGYGVSSLSAGSSSVIASNAAPVASIPASAMPASASSTMSTLSVASVSAPVGGAATGVAAAAAGGAGFGVVAPLVAIGVGAGIAAAAAAADDDDAAPSHSTTTHH